MTSAAISNREMEVAKLLAVGKTNGEIGVALKISVKTVDTHRGHVMKKLGLRNNVELCLHAHKWGWVTTEGLTSTWDTDMHAGTSTADGLPAIPGADDEPVTPTS